MPIYKAMLEREFVGYAHRRGVLVKVWLVATEKEVETALDAEIDFITIDDPQQRQSRSNSAANGLNGHSFKHPSYVHFSF